MNNSKNWKPSDAPKDDCKLLLLSIVDGCSILGAAAVCYDGVTLAAILPEGFEQESVSGYSLKAFEGAQRMLAEINQGRLIGMISVTQQGYLSSYDFGGGLLITLGQDTSPDFLGPLLQPRQ